MLLLLLSPTTNNQHRFQASKLCCRFFPSHWPAGNAPPKTFSSDRNFDFATTGTPMPQRGRSVYSTIPPRANPRRSAALIEPKALCQFVTLCY